MNKARFNELFDRWAEEYDRAVSGGHPEYREVFQGYTDILKTVVETLDLPAGSHVVEIGVGTGNLSRLLLAAGYRVTGVEPSARMRRQAKEKVPELALFDGDFLHLPPEVKGARAVVSTYAFHHLTDEEKKVALQGIVTFLPSDGQVVFADTAFKDTQAKRAMQREAREKGYFELAQDLEREFYPEIPRLREIFSSVGLDFELRQLNRFVWLMAARRRSLA